jgi:hypothetical protein
LVGNITTEGFNGAITPDACYINNAVTQAGFSRSRARSW